MRIVTLLPSATEIVCALGLDNWLVGVSHECDYPADVVTTLPKLTRSAIPSGLSGAEIDAAVSSKVRRGESLYSLDEELLAKLQPDLLITQELCDVCAVSFDDVCSASTRLPGNPKVISLNPPNLNGIFDDVMTVAQACGCEERGRLLVARLHERMTRVHESVRGLPHPRVFAMEWFDPPFNAGHWVPEMIACAGGEEVLGHAGEKSVRVTWQQVAQAQPEVILLIPCGYNAEEAQRLWDGLSKPKEWLGIPAARSGRVFALDAGSYCSRPAPRVVDGIELLANLLHPQIVTNHERYN